MPSKSPAQAKLMRAVAHGWKMPGGGGPSRGVAREFMDADQKVKGYQFGGGIRTGIDDIRTRHLQEPGTQPDYDPITAKYGTEPISGAQAKKSSGKEGIVSTLGSFQDLMGAGWTPVSGSGDFDSMMWYPPQLTFTGGLGAATQTGGYAVPNPSTRTGTDFDPGSIAEEIYNKYGIIDPTWTEYDRTSQTAMQEDPLAHLGADDPARAEYEGWNQQREEMDRVRGLATYPEMPGKQSPQREQLRQHKARVSDILSGGGDRGGGGGNAVIGGTPGFYERPENRPIMLEEEEPVEMQFGGLAQAMQRQRGSMGRRGSPQMMQAMQRQTGRGGPSPRGGMQSQLQSQRGSMGRRGSPQMQARMQEKMAQRRGQPARGGFRGQAQRQMAQRRGAPMGRGNPQRQEMMQRMQAGQRGMPQRPGPMKQLGRPGGGGRVQPGGPGGMPGGRGEMIRPDDARMPGGRAMPLRGFQQKQAMQRRGNLGGNRVGSADQQGGLARAMQKQTGRPPISRRSAFPGRAR